LGPVHDRSVLVPEPAVVTAASGGVRGAVDVNDVPGELLTGERVAEAVSGDLSGPVLCERVERLSVVGDLTASVGTLDDAELTREGVSARRSGADGSKVRPPAPRRETKRGCFGASAWIVARRSVAA
jgi:hypothetical protein